MGISKIMRLFFSCAVGLMGSLLFHEYALAQLAMPDSMGIEDAILGDDTAGSETALSDIIRAILTSLPILLGIVIIVCGFYIAKKFFRRAFSGA